MNKQDLSTKSGESNILTADGLALDLDSRTLIMNGTVRKLTPKECHSWPSSCATTDRC